MFIVDDLHFISHVQDLFTNHQLLTSIAFRNNREDVTLTIIIVEIFIGNELQFMPVTIIICRRVNWTNEYSCHFLKVISLNVWTVVKPNNICVIYRHVCIGRSAVTSYAITFMIVLNEYFVAVLKRHWIWLFFFCLNHDNVFNIVLEQVLTNLHYCLSWYEVQFLSQELKVIRIAILSKSILKKHKSRYENTSVYRLITFNDSCLVKCINDYIAY